MFQSAPEPAQAGTIVTVNRTVSRRLRGDYDGQRSSPSLQVNDARVWEAPDILPYGAWVSRLWRELAALDPLNTPLLLNAVQEDFLWRRAIAKSPYADDLLDLASTATMAANAWELMHAWELSRAESAFQETADSQAFFTWMGMVEAELRTERWVTRSELPAQLMKRGISVQGPLTHAGFVEMTPRDAQLLQMVGATARSRNSSVDTVSIERKLANANDELTQAALWARTKLESATRPLRIAVMIPALAQARLTTERIFDDVLHPSLDFAREHQPRLFHISTGVASSEVPLIATALLVLGLKPGLTLSEAGLLLRSPFLKLDRVRAAEWDAKLRRKRASRVHFEDLAGLLPGLAHKAKHLFEAAERFQYTSQWPATFSDLIASAGWAERSPNASERQVTEHWRALLSDLASLDLVEARVSYEQALAHLWRIARQKSFHAEDTGSVQDQNEAPIQIVDLREGAAAALPYDAIWVAGLHAGAWPEAARPNPFVPLPLQRAAGIPQSSPGRALQRAREATARLKQSATEVVFSYPAMEGEQELRPSPLLEPSKFIEESALPDTALGRLYASPPLLDAMQPGRTHGKHQAGQTSRGGAHLLADQAACPFKAFAVHRLGARELDAPEVGVSPRERGNAVHVALQAIWEKLGSQHALKQLSGEERAQLIHECAQAAIDAKSQAPERFRRLELNRLNDLLTKWMEEEARRPPFHLLQSENDQEVPIGDLTLQIRPDRIDRYNHDDSLAILDYKTGKKLSPDDWDGERPDAPQLPLYAVNAANRGYKVASVMYVQLAAGMTKMHPREGRALQESLPYWQRVLNNLASEFVVGPAQVDPKKGRKTCDWCRLQSFCRVEELGVLSDGGDEEGDAD